MIGLVTQYGVALVFANVLIQQIGLPIPVVPTLIVAGALAADGKLPHRKFSRSRSPPAPSVTPAWYVAGRVCAAVA